MLNIKKISILSTAILAICTSSSLFAADIEPDTCTNCQPLDKIADATTFDDATYYSAATSAISSSATLTELKTAINTDISAVHKNLTYSEVWSALTATDEDPSNPDNVILLYSGISIAKASNGSGAASTNPDNWNREHVWAKSHGFPDTDQPGYTDVHHLRPTDISINASRGNLDFDNSDNALTESPDNRVDGDSFEPRDLVKGDVARMVFYMDTRYEGFESNMPDLKVVDSLSISGSAELGRLCRLIEWHNADPVSLEEQVRNDVIYEYQGNRNPFIDHPEWADMLYVTDACSGDAGTGGGTGDGGSGDGSGDGGDTDGGTDGSASIIITGVIDGPLRGGIPKAVELYVTADIADLGTCGIGGANNGGGTDGQEFTFPTGAVGAGTYIYVASESTGFQSFFGFEPDYTSFAANINGDDAIELFCDGVVVDVLGEIDVDGTGEAWEYKDGWTSRNAGSTPNGGNFNIDEWTFSGKDALDGESSNETATSPFPLQAFSAVAPSRDPIMLSGVFDGPLTGGVPKAIEIYIAQDIPDLSVCGVGSANNAGGTDGEELTFDAGPVSAGTFIYVATETNGFTTFFGFAPDYTDSAASINGDDSIELFCNGEVVDVFGDVGIDGTGDPWEYKDGWAYRVNGTGADGSTFILENWIFSGKDTNDGESDNATAATPFPLGSFTGGSSEEPVDLLGQCYDEATLISTIQGNAFASLLVGELHVIEGVVTSSVSALGGFFMQEEQEEGFNDADDTTSDGIFVDYDSELPTEGSIVRVIGNVAERYGKTQLNATQDSVYCADGFIAATAISLPFESTDRQESLEGMLVSGSNLTVTDNYNLGRYGEVTLSNGRLYNPTNLHQPGSVEVTELAASNALNRVILDDGVNGQNPADVIYPTGGLSAMNTLRTGDEVSSVVGILDYSFGQYRIIPTETPLIVATNARMSEPDFSGGNLRVASFNVLNYFNGDGIADEFGELGGFPTSRGADTNEEFVRQRAKIISAIASMQADVIGLLEIENDGFGEQSALQNLVNGLNDIAPDGVHYSFVNPNIAADVDSGIEELGGDAIKVALIYNDMTVTEFGTAAYLVDFPFEYHNRPPMAQTFRAIETGERLTVAINHFRSKGCSSSGGAENEDMSDGQGCYNLRRVQAAEAITVWLATHPTGIEDDDILIIGDLNAYSKEDPVTVIKDADYVNLSELFNGDEAYSYTFRGENGILDHALATTPLTDKVVGTTHWHINADEPRILDYNTEYKSDEQLATFYNDDAYRASDHDPVVISIEGVTPLISVKNVYTEQGTLARWTTYEFDVPETSVHFTATITGGEGNVDLYVREGKKPNTQKFDCAPKTDGNEEVCVMEFPTAGKWYVRLRGERHFSGVTLTLEAEYPEPLE